RSDFAPTPTSPVYGVVPGALPPHFAYVYDSSYRGWPITPVHEQHPVPYIVHYAPGTIEDDNMQERVGPPQKPTCARTYWYRPFSQFNQEYWNTRTSPNGRYDVTVTAADLAGNTARRTATVTIRN
ncbi:MAG: hypothetical protein ACXVHL_30675, partial [Solirubrobacteraceae bacterium]